MNKIEVNLGSVKDEIKSFYKEKEHFYVAMNGIDVGNGVEVQWFFVDYSNPNNMTVFTLIAGYEETIPSINSFIPSAWVTEAEFYDLFNVEIEGCKKGFFLEEDSNNPPHRRSK
jgi:NADH:ubiquinone oxidoreductase subunit C